jgi:hypothetical protein
LGKWRWKTQIGDRVVFPLSSVFLPDSQEALELLSLKSKVNGVIVDFSDSGNVPRAFAIVDIIHRRTVVVPVDKLELDEDRSGKDLA